MKILKKIRKAINSSVKESDEFYSLTKQLMPICFNTSVHGENVRLSNDGLVAKRKQSFCKGIVFSNRALLINEEISIIVTSLNKQWNGSLRFGFCNVNPYNFKNKLPKYMCPNLTNLQGFYARALKDEETQIGSVITFWLNEYGQIMYKIDGHLVGVFDQVDYHHINKPMWAMIDIYGLVDSIKIVNTDNFVFHNKPESTRSMNDLNNLSSNFSDLNLNYPVFSSPQHRNSHNLNGNFFLTLQPKQAPISRFYKNVDFNRMQLSETTGVNIKLNSNRTIASRKNLSTNFGYVFTERPLNLNEKLVIQILKNDQLFNGNLGFGLTTCNPANLKSFELPEDSHKLIDRKEYWIIIKDVLANAKAGDELSFMINDANQVLLTKNDLPPVKLFQVEANQRFYALFDLHGKTTKISVLGTFYEKNQVQFINTINQNLSQNLINRNLSNVIQLKQSPKVENNLNKFSPSQYIPLNDQIRQSNKMVNLSPETLEKQTKINQGTQNINGECTICFEQSINCVLYQCGHMCMCYDCARKQWNNVGGGQCPICRREILDVIRTYWS